MSVLELFEEEGNGSLERAANEALLSRPRPGPTRRHLEILQAMSHGLTYPQVATQLGISIETVKEHMKVVRGRLGARNTNQAIATAIRLGLMP